MRPLYKGLWITLVVLLSVIVTIYTLNQIILRPDHVIHELGGDAIKNLNTYVTHSLWGNGWWYDWMNYPYGEHLIYTDGFPLLSIPLTWIREFVDLQASQLIAVLNITLAVGFFLAIIYVYRTLRLLSTGRVFSLVGAILITAMSPQLNKVFGHYGLAIICVIPMLLFYTIKYQQYGKLSNIWKLLILGVAAMFMHPYFIAIVLIWVFFYVLSSFIVKKNSFSEKLRFLLPLLVVPVICIVILKVLMFLTDPITDRPKIPLGTLSQCTTGLDIFTSDKSPVWLYLQSIGWVNELSLLGNEHYTYTGLVVIVIMIIFIITIIYKHFKKKETKIINEVPYTRILLLTAIFCLLFGMGVPFVWKMEWLLDYLPSFRQFRTLGRFSQLYYYTTAILAVALLYQWFKVKLNKDKKIVAVSVVLLSIIVWGSEAYTHVYEPIHKRSEAGHWKYDAYVAETYKGWKEALNDYKYKATDFQAILALPYIHVGSEKIWTEGSSWGGFCIPTIASYQLQLPMVNAQMSRSSWSITFKQVRVAGGPYANKPVFENAGNKPFLLLVYKDVEMNEDEQYLISLADSIGEHDQHYIYKIYPEKVNAFERALSTEIRKLSQPLEQGVDTSISNADYYYEHFDTGTSDIQLSSTSAMKPIFKFGYDLTTIDVSQWLKGQNYECSFWAKISEEDYKAPSYQLHLLDSNNNAIKVEYAYTRQATDNYDMWLRASRYFILPANCAKILIKLIDNDEGSYLSMDELLIRRADDTVIYKAVNDKIMVNNHILDVKRKD